MGYGMRMGHEVDPGVSMPVPQELVRVDVQPAWDSYGPDPELGLPAVQTTSAPAESGFPMWLWIAGAVGALFLFGGGRR